MFLCLPLFLPSVMYTEGKVKAYLDGSSLILSVVTVTDSSVL